MKIEIFLEKPSLTCLGRESPVIKLIPENDAEKYQLDFVERQLQKGNIRFFPDRQWEIKSISIFLPKKNCN